jgi:hypothetical protein
MTKEQIIEQLKIEYPLLKKGSDQTGYENLNDAEYNETISNWADNLIAKAAEEAETLAKEQTRVAAEAKLAALGLTADDLKALGLGNN